MRNIILAFVAALLLSACNQQTTEESGSVDFSKQWPPVSEGAKVETAANILVTNYLVLLDNSGSMNDSDCSGDKSKFEVAKDALKNFASTLPVNDNISLLIFGDGGAKVVVPFGSGIAHVGQFKSVLSGLSADEGTPLRGALQFSYETMMAQAQRQLGYGVYRIIVVTDGESTDGSPGPVAVDIVRQSPVEVHAIGFCVGTSHSLNVPGFTRYYTASDPKALADGLAAAQAETPTFDATSLLN